MAGWLVRTELLHLQHMFRNPWHVWEEDETGNGISYFYATREQARAHMRRVRNNPFLKGWLVRGINVRTGTEVM